MSAHQQSARLLRTLFYKNFLPKNNHVQQSRTLTTSTPPLHAKVAFKLSDIGEGIREVAVKEWFVKEGDTVKQFDNICEVQSDKASVTITSRYDGVVAKLHYKIDDTALVGQPLLDIEVEDDGGTSSSSSSSDEEAEKVKVPEIKMSIEKNVEIIEQPSSLSSSKEICIPSVRRLAKEHSIDLSRVRGSGKDGRILKEDVLNFMQSPASSAPVLKTEVTISHQPIIGVLAKEDRTEPIKGFQKAMVRTMTEALKIPTFVYSDEMHVTRLSQMRKDVKEEFLAMGIKISFMPFFIKAASNALAKYPILNATVDVNCEHVTYKAAHNIGVAMDTKVGLAVPVIKDCQALNVAEIARELSRLMAAGKAGSFNPMDLQGGTFAISNIGAIGGTYTKPIILPPQVAILAIGAAKLLPRFDQNMQVVAEEVVSLSGAADHRIVDGATMAHFTNAFKRQIENPNLLFLNL